MKNLICLLLALLKVSSVVSVPYTFDVNESPEARHHKNKGNRFSRPCGRNALPESRKFLDLSVEFLDVSYNYNYICGGGGPTAPVGGHLQGVSNLVNHFQLGNRPGGGIFGLLFGSGLPPSQAASSSSAASASAGGTGVSTGVNVPQDPVLPDRLRRPGQYVTVSNSLLGSYTQELPNVNTDKVVRQITRDFNRFVLRPFYHLL